MYCLYDCILCTYMLWVLLCHAYLHTYVYYVYIILYAVFSACDRNVCLNGGTCSQHDFEYRCDCPPFYSGLYCETCELAWQQHYLTGELFKTSSPFLTNPCAVSPTARNFYITLGVVLGVAVFLTVAVILTTILCYKFMPNKYKEFR